MATRSTGPLGWAANWMLRHPLIGLAVLGAAAVLLLWWLQGISDPGLRNALQTAVVGLLFTGLLGGLVRLLLDALAAKQRRVENAAEFVTNVLADLKAVYERAGRARLLIAADRSAETYRAEMRGLIDARVQLRNVARALDTRPPEDIRSKDAVLAEIGRMEDYLQSLLAEFVGEAGENPLLDDSGGGGDGRARPAPAPAEAGAGAPAAAASVRRRPRSAWRRLVEGLPRLKGFLDGDPDYESGFRRPLDEASKLLRAELARILDGRAT